MQISNIKELPSSIINCKCGGSCPSCRTEQEQKEYDYNKRWELQQEAISEWQSQRGEED